MLVPSGKVNLPFVLVLGREAGNDGSAGIDQSETSQERLKEDLAAESDRGSLLGHKGHVPFDGHVRQRTIVGVADDDDDGSVMFVEDIGDSDGGLRHDLECD